MSKWILDIETNGLDIYISKILGIGLMDIEKRKVYIEVSHNEESLIKWFSKKVSDGDTIIGYNVRNFDLPMILSRSLVHDIKIPHKFKIVDISSILHQGIYAIFGSVFLLRKRLRMDDFCRLFNIGGEYGFTGMLVPSERDLKNVEFHLSDDINKIYLLYERLKRHGLI